MNIFSLLEIDVWIGKHWLTAPMLTKGMAEQVVAIERNYVQDVAKYLR